MGIHSLDNLTIITNQSIQIVYMSNINGLYNIFNKNIGVGKFTSSFVFGPVLFLFPSDDDQTDSDYCIGTNINNQFNLSVKYIS